MGPPLLDSIVGTGISPQDYTFPTFVDIARTFQSFYDDSNIPSSVHVPTLRRLFIPQDHRGPGHTFLFIFADAFGLNHLNTLGPDSFVKQHFKCVTRAIFPSSTPCCMTSLLTGVYPAQHGCIGRIYLRDSSVMVQSLQMTEFRTQKPISVCSFVPIRSFLI